MGVMLHEGRMYFMKSFFPIRGQLLTYVIALAPREFSSVNLVEQCFQFRVRSFSSSSKIVTGIPVRSSASCFEHK